MTRAYLQIILLVVISLLSGVVSALADEPHIIKAKISDIDGRPMEGGKLFLYDSPNVRRPADFISSLSGRGGLIQVIVPPGKYWVVARFKSDGKYGPLLPGDKHSGEPLEIDVTSGIVETEFVIADIRELGQKKRAGATDALRLKGRVVDSQGAPVAQAVVFASRSNEFSEYPDFISAWTGDDGGYEIYVTPGGAYFVGVSRRFPLISPVEPETKVVVESGKIDIAIDINLTVQ